MGSVTWVVVDGCNDEAAEKMPSPNAEQTQLDLSSGGGFFPKGYPSLQAAKEHTAHIIINGEKLKAFPLNSGKRQGCPLSQLLFKIVFKS